MNHNNGNIMWHGDFTLNNCYLMELSWEYTTWYFHTAMEVMAHLVRWFTSQKSLIVSPPNLVSPMEVGVPRRTGYGRGAAEVRHGHFTMGYHQTQISWETGSLWWKVDGRQYLSNSKYDLIERRRMFSLIISDHMEVSQLFGVPRNKSSKDRIGIFHETNHPAIGIPPFQKPPYMNQSFNLFSHQGEWIFDLALVGIGGLTG